MAAASTFARYVDEAKRLETQLRLATRESGSFVQAQQDVRRIAQASRGDIEAIANLYATFQRNARELGITQAEAARLTETVTKSFQISGASAEEAAGGLRQFLQGLQSGVLRGEEFNSVMENAPRLAKALADELGVTVGQLRTMSQEGQLTGQRVTTALLSASQAIDEEFRQIPVTFDQAMTQVNNAAIVAFGAFDQGGEFSDALINFAGTGRMSFDDIARAAFETGQEIRGIFAGLADAFMPMGEGASNVFDFIRSEAEGLGRGISDMLNTLQDGLNLAQNIAGASFDLRTMSMTYPEQFTFGDRFEQTRNANSQNAGLLSSRSILALTNRNRPASARPRGGSTRIGGGGGGRRRGGGGSRRQRAPLSRPGNLEESSLSPAIDGPSAGEMFDYERSLGRAVVSAEELRELLQPLPEAVITSAAQEQLLGFISDFTDDLVGGLAQAIAYGDDLGDVLEQTFRRAAAAAIESGLAQLFGAMTGQNGGGGSGILGAIASAVGLVPGIAGGSFGPKKGLKGFASGGSFMVGGNSGVDKNILSLNGTPVARVSKGETVGVGWGGGGSKLEIVPSPYFDVVVDGRVVSTGGPMVAVGMGKARAGAQMDIARRQRRSIP